MYILAHIIDDYLEYNSYSGTIRCIIDSCFETFKSYIIGKLKRNIITTQKKFDC